MLCVCLLILNLQIQNSLMFIKGLAEKYDNVKELKLGFLVYMIAFKIDGGLKHNTMIKKNLLQVSMQTNTKSRMRMVTLYQITGSQRYIVGTETKWRIMESVLYKYGDGGVDIAIADLYKTKSGN